ncbi:1-phosphofructokinase [Jeongeupia naejangsanensis]|uniref:1-phosphofructokinase n=1 Tax=Jeongeupia naejangsanensis TaxID=613195 RepID=A0ABS2BHI5_9NEIS|nr:1-phosphofructokinase [Jeongeupia naejangsanensis]MBM3115080.1 1-phosphofructokinase [Jeongeupia naejangsanensis]
MALLLTPALARLNASPADKKAAIAEVAALLAEAGFIDPAYGDSMLAREDQANTYLSHGVAIPHGIPKDRHLVKQTGIAVLQVPAGVMWMGEEKARFIVGIAAQNDEHIAVLRRLTRLLGDEARLERLFVTGDVNEIVAALADEAPAAAAPAGGVADFSVKAEIVLDYPSGLHARPASGWVGTAKRFNAQLRVRHGDEIANAKSMVSLLQLGAEYGARLTVSAEGDDASDAIAALCATIAELSHAEKANAPAGFKPAASTAPARPPAAGRATEPSPDDPLVAGKALELALRRVERHLTREAASEMTDAATREVMVRRQAYLGYLPLLRRVSARLLSGQHVVDAWRDAVGETARDDVLAPEQGDLQALGEQVSLALKQKPVVTVTCNPAIDLTVALPSLRAGEVNLAADAARNAGGKGINVAACLADYGLAVTVTGFLGRDNAAVFERFFDDRGLDNRMVGVDGETRINIKLVDEQRRQTTDLNLPSFTVDADAQQALERELDTLAGNAAWVVLSGSLPIGVPAGFYRFITALMHAQGVKVALDTSGEALRASLSGTASAALPHLVKPNRRELEQWAGRALPTLADVVAAAQELQQRGIAQVVVSLGEEGALLVEADAVRQALPPALALGSTVGAGDALVAGLIAAQLEGRYGDDALRRAVACASAKLAVVGPALPAQSDIDAIAARVEIRRIEQPSSHVAPAHATEE